jgi:hypothetical protein
MTLREILNAYPEQVYDYEIILRNAYTPDTEMQVYDALINRQDEHLIIEYV